MAETIINTQKEVHQVFDSYPEDVQIAMQNLRKLVLEVATESKEISNIEECLRWGEPSYISPIGSTLRMDWKEKNPKQYALYFKCTSKLVESFKHVYKDSLRYEGNRAIIFNLGEAIPEKDIKTCIHSALTYHKIKHLPYLGLATPSGQ
jgi:hypothetical protein